MDALAGEPERARESGFFAVTDELSVDGGGKFVPERSIDTGLERGTEPWPTV